MAMQLQRTTTIPLPPMSHPRSDGFNTLALIPPLANNLCLSENSHGCKSLRVKMITRIVNIQYNWKQPVILHVSRHHTTQYQRRCRPGSRKGYIAKKEMKEWMKEKEMLVQRRVWMKEERSTAEKMETWHSSRNTPLHTKYSKALASPQDVEYVLRLRLYKDNDQFDIRGNGTNFFNLSRKMLNYHVTFDKMPLCYDLSEWGKTTVSCKMRRERAYPSSKPAWKEKRQL